MHTSASRAGLPRATSNASRLTAAAPLPRLERASCLGGEGVRFLRRAGARQEETRADADLLRCNARATATLRDAQGTAVGTRAHGRWFGGYRLELQHKWERASW